MSLGRYPFMTLIPKYMEDHALTFSPGTAKDRKRCLEWIGRRLEILKEDGCIMMTNPKRLKRDDALAILNDFKGMNWKQSYLEKMISTLGLFVGYQGNPVFKELASARLIPRTPAQPPKSIGRDQLKTLSEGAEKLTGWHGDVARFLVAIFPSTGARPSELRMARYEDLDIMNWTLHIRHPKGEGRYALPRDVPILEEARKAVLRFLKAREERLAKAGIDTAEPLIPRVKIGKATYYTVPGFRRMQLSIEAASGVDFRWKDMRPIFIQRILDKDPSKLYEAAVLAGHMNPYTTLRYYATIRNDLAIERVQAMMSAPGFNSTQSKLIERKAPITGYA